ncbi:peptidylprolyl isomerase [Candidatus Epulonipiscium viviparus]|uniref:peptidylprolyl isomerase n=1 Tax=Candidatus Epulonipiscium viviparus TaxID=420336 RepID=UPI00273809C2|nr:peptidylprolyl isomerase [Candidatus Epulopiscium viviparus]
MKLTKKIVAMVLAGVLSVGALAACAASMKDNADDSNVAGEATGGASESAFNNGVMGDGVTLGVNDLVATIDDVKINESIYRAYLWSAQSAFEMQLGMDMGIMKDMEIEGQTIGEIAKDNALKSVALAIITNNKADEMDLKLTADELALIEADASTFIDINGEIAKLHGFTKQDVIDLLIGAELSDKVQRALSETYMPAEEEINERVELAKPSYEKVTARHILIGTVDETGAPVSDEVKAEKLALANELLDRIKAGEDIGKLAAEYSEDPGSKSTNGEYTFGRGEMVPEFEAAAFDNADGAIWAEPVETSYGYHIGQTIDHIEADEDAIRDEYIAYAQMNFAGEEIMSFVEAAKIDTTDAYEKIDLITNVAPEQDFELMPEDTTAHDHDHAGASVTASSDNVTIAADDVEIAKEEVESDDVAITKEEVDSDDVAITKEEVDSDDVTIAKEEVDSDDVAITKEEVESDDVAITKEEVDSDDVAITKEEVESDDVAITKEAVADVVLAEETVASESTAPIEDTVNN